MAHGMNDTSQSRVKPLGFQIFFSSFGTVGEGAERGILSAEADNATPSLYHSPRLGGQLEFDPGNLLPHCLPTLSMNWLTVWLSLKETHPMEELPVTSETSFWTRCAKAGLTDV